MCRVVAQILKDMEIILRRRGTGENYQAGNKCGKINNLVPENERAWKVVEDLKKEIFEA